MGGPTTAALRVLFLSWAQRDWVVRIPLLKVSHSLEVTSRHEFNFHCSCQSISLFCCSFFLFFLLLGLLQSSSAFFVVFFLLLFLFSLVIPVYCPCSLSLFTVSVFFFLLCAAPLVQCATENVQLLYVKRNRVEPWAIGPLRVSLHSASCKYAHCCEQLLNNILRWHGRSCAVTACT